jgi:NADH-quinone oxidoreductase subunit K
MFQCSNVSIFQLPKVSMVSTEYYVALSAIIFAIGAVGVLTRRSAIMVFLCVELMLNAANLALVAFARQWAGVNATMALSGQTAVFIILAVAAAEVAVGLGILVAIFRYRASTEIDSMAEVRL